MNRYKFDLVYKLIMGKMLDMGYVYEEINVKHFVPPSYDLSI